MKRKRIPNITFSNIRQAWTISTRKRLNEKSMKQAKIVNITKDKRNEQREQSRGV